jgi:hypothetical protein
MNIKAARRGLLWCSIINYGLLVVWFLVFAFMHEWLLRSWGRWFHLSAEQFDFLNLAGMMLLKILIMVFNLVPFIALLIVGRATNDDALGSSFSEKEKQT